MRAPILLLLAVLEAAVLAGCNKGPNPYLQPGSPTATPADRTGGARDVPDGYCRGPAQPPSQSGQNKPA